MKHKLVISNYWHNPGITVKLWKDAQTAPQGAIELSMNFEDFIQGFLQEHKHPVKIWTRAQLETAIREAITTVLEKTKEASVEGIR